MRGFSAQAGLSNNVTDLGSGVRECIDFLLDTSLSIRGIEEVHSSEIGPCLARPNVGVSRGTLPSSSSMVSSSLNSNSLGEGSGSEIAQATSMAYRAHQAKARAFL